MKPSDYKERCIELLKKFNATIDAPVLDQGITYPEMESIIRDFKHLVYAFDCNLPLYKEISESDLRVVTPYMGTEYHESSVKRVRGFMEYFIKYIEEYCE